LVTTTFRRPVVAPDGIENVQVICVGETTVTPVAPISGSPVLVSFTVAPDTKLEPARLVILIELPRIPVFGIIEVTVGAGVDTVI